MKINYNTVETAYNDSGYNDEPPIATENGLFGWPVAKYKEKIPSITTVIFAYSDARTGYNDLYFTENGSKNRL